MTIKPKKICGFLIVLALIFPVFIILPSPALSAPETKKQQTSGEISKELDVLKDQADVLSASVENMEETWARIVNVSGYMDAEYIIDDRKGKPDGFRVHHFSLFLEKKLSRDWSVFSELEFEDAPFLQASSPESISAAQGKILLEQAYTDFHAAPNISFRIGRFLTPAGIWNINHYPPFVTTQSRPLHIRNIFPQYLDGIQAHGDVNALDYLISYKAYVANGEGNSGTGDENEEKAIGGRIEFTAPFVIEVKLGFSAISDKLNSGSDKTATGVDAQFRFSWLKIQGEYAQAKIKPVEGTTFNAVGYYLQGQTDIGRWTLFVRHDYYDANDSLPDNGLAVNTAGLNYHWTPTIVSKIEGNFYDFKSLEVGEDYASWILSLAVFF